ncbi:GT2 family glycosyltransferase [Aurantimicrobium minutum]|uniref:glycosyltransferase n=1 Tax=Aurantimicrobium minutum TaxID=708131 RepID=UPI002473DDF2|nr:glycosyltransferase [Aurantimicrobium minutum]MDH6531823.1 GT2 family glycosyltransferase [Aurantimicrobium minutum]
MKTRVTAIIVARQGGEHLARTLDALAKQTRRPDIVIAVDNSTKVTAQAQLQVFGPSQVLRGGGKLSYGEALDVAAKAFPAVTGPDDFLWFLAQDSAPAPDALAQLIGALEVSPSVAIAGPKQMDWERPDYIREYGVTLAQGGRTISLVVDELDQAQHDLVSDVMAVGANGMLVRQQVWEQLGGFDPHLTVVDDALDFCVRARLAGHRVSVVPTARVLNAGDGVIGPVGTDSYRARKKRARQYRSAELYRRLVYCSGAAVFWHWLGLLPSAILRSLGQLLAKRPGAVSGEFRSAFSAAFSGGSVGRARRKLRSTKTAPWSALAPLRVTRADVRRREALAREAAQIRKHGEKRPLHFFSGGGAWVVMALLFVSIGANSPLVGATAISGGGLLPLSATVSELWSSLGWGWRAGAFGVVGPADAFSGVIALLGTLTFWQPSFSLVLLWFLALPIAGLGAWLLTARMTQRAGIRAFVAIGYALSPALLGGLTEARPAAVLTHLLLPFLFFAGIRAARSWSASATTALLFAAVVACSPSLTPALLVIWLGTILLTGRSVPRFLAIPIPAAALVAPLVVMQVLGLNLFGLAADPGPATGSVVPPQWQLALGFPTDGLGGWLLSIDSLPWANPVASVWVAILVGVLVALAFVGLFSQYPIRAQLAVLVMVLGLATAVLASGLQVSFDGSEAVAIWPGSGLSLAWLGLMVAAGTGASILRRFSFYPAFVGITAVVLLAAPSLAAANLGTAQVYASNGQTLPAYVVAQAAIEPEVGTLVLTPQPDGGLGTDLVRGTGLTLESVSTYVTTGAGFAKQESVLAETASNLSSVSGTDSTDALTTLGVGFILLTPPLQAVGEEISPDAQTISARVKATLDANPGVEIVGKTDAGLLWRFPGYDAAATTIPEPSLPVEPWRLLILSGQALVILLTLLLAIPTGTVMSDLRPKRYLPGLIESDDDPVSADPLAGDQDVEQN